MISKLQKSAHGVERYSKKMQSEHKWTLEAATFLEKHEKPSTTKVSGRNSSTSVAQNVSLEPPILLYTFRPLSLSLHENDGKGSPG